MRKLALLGAIGLVVLGAPPKALADVQLTMQGGRVTLHAKDATLRQILAEWARVGQTRIVNGERVPGGPLTIELTNVTEQQALEILLRTVSGYLAAPRAATTANSSVFDRIIIIPTSVAPAAVASAAPPPAFAQPTFVQQQPVPQVLNDDQDDDRATPPGGPGGPGSGVGAPQNRGPVFMFSPPQVTNPQQVPTLAPGNTSNPSQQVTPQIGTPGAAPTVLYPGAATTATPAGVAAPGMVVPTPQTSQPIIVIPAQPQR